jgi:dTDP-4-amino-4,6-dideoxygalactose transaminase
VNPSPQPAAKTPPIAFVDLAAQQARIAAAVEAAIAKELAHGQFIMGPEVAQLEHELAAWAGVKHVVSCASGTDALVLPLMAMGIGRGDAVYVPSFTFAATAEVVALVGATPVFVDVRADTFNLDPASLAAAIAATPKELKARAVIPVDLFGQPADYDEILALAARRGLKVISDAAQSFGASYRTRPVGRFGDATGTSFFPAKPLGCYGDGGAVFTDDDALAARMRSLRVHGQGSNKYENVAIGLNARLDTLQAAILLEKLKIFRDEIAARDRAAERYRQGLGNLLATPPVLPGNTSVWAQYTIKLADRDRVASALKAAGVPTAVYYPAPLHRQPAYRNYPCAPAGAPVSEELSRTVLSLPMHPYLDAPTQDRIVAAVRAAL